MGIGVVTSRLGGDPILVLAVEVIGSVSGQILLALSAEELVSERAILATELFDFVSQFVGALHRQGVHGLRV